MSKVLDATCEAGIVKVGTVAIPEAIKLCEGIAPSVGNLIIQGDKMYYVAKTTPDVKTLITQMIALLTDVKTGLQLLDSRVGLVSATGGVPNVVVATSTIASITSKIATLTTLKDNLK